MTLTLALVIYISTTLLVKGYSSNLSGMAEIIKPSELLLVIEEGKSLSESRINIEVLNFLEEYSSLTPNLEVILPEIYIPIDVIGETGTRITTHLRLLNISEFERFQSHHYEYYPSEIQTDEVIIGQQLAYLISAGIGSSIRIEFEDYFANDSYELTHNESYSVTNIIKSGHEYDIELLGSLSNFDLNTTLNFFSFIELRVLDIREIDTIRKDILDEFSELEILNQKQTQNFITYATNDVIRTLTLLEILFFVLMLVSISYSIYTLVKESEEEIFTLRSIGATRSQIVMLFMLQSLYIGLISAILSLVLGYLAVTGIVGLVTATMNLPYIALSIDTGLVGTIFLFSLILSILSGILPALEASKIKVIREDVR
jgi:ABC-type lipoprotein release transport system permease subunit